MKLARSVCNAHRLQPQRSPHSHSYKLLQQKAKANLPFVLDLNELKYSQVCERQPRHFHQREKQLKVTAVNITETKK